DLLDAPHAFERHAEESCRIARCLNPIEGIFVRVQGDRPSRLIRLRRLLPQDDDDLPRDNREGSEAPRWVAEDRAVPLGKRQVELNSFRPSDRDPDSSSLPVEPIRLVLRLQHEAAQERDGGPLSLPYPAPMGLQDGQGDLEGRRDVLLVDRVARAEVLVRSPSESSARADVFLQGDSDRFVHEYAELCEEPTEMRVVPRDGKDEGPVGEHTLR